MVFRDVYRKQHLFWKYVKNETVADYLNGMELLKQKGWHILGVVCEGKSGLLNAIKTIPVHPDVRHKEHRAYYNPKDDFVNMPEAKTFIDSESYYTTLFHELVHL